MAEGEWPLSSAIDRPSHYTSPAMKRIRTQDSIKFLLVLHHGKVKKSLSQALKVKNDLSISMLMKPRSSSPCLFVPFQRKVDE